MSQTVYEIFSTLTGRRVSVAVYFSEQNARAIIQNTRDLVACGRDRQDLVGKVDFYSVRERVYSE